MPIQLSNDDARRIFLARQGLCASPSRAFGKATLLELITTLGFVQVDSIATVERAHHHILFSRAQGYRREHLTALLERDRTLFEHWTHDAAIIPSAFFVYWKHRFQRESETLAERWRNWREAGFEAAFSTVLDRVTQQGPLLSRDFEEKRTTPGGWWNWHPSKTALEYLWRTGKLAIHAREGFQKVYDLTERVMPAHHRDGEVSREAFVDWACTSALERLGFATHGEIAAFWNLVSPEEAKAWVAANTTRLVPVVVTTTESGSTSKPRPCHALASHAECFDTLPAPPARLRVLSPFDPLLRDRARAQRLFGFDYRIEVFVPAPKRVYGYYVFPLLEGDRLVGRIDMKADRKAGTLEIRRLWLEPGVRSSTGRLDKLDAELCRLARFTGVERVHYLDGWRGA